MSATSGLTSATPLARWDRESSCWRTSPDTCLWDLPMSLGTLPAWGMTQGGELFELPTPERRTSEPGSSSLPTPTVQDGNNTAGPSQMSRNTLPLNALVMMLPTPVADHSRGLPQPESDYQSLPNVALSLLPTPRGQDEYERRNHKTMVRIRDEGGDMTLPTWAKVVAPSLGVNTSQPSGDGSDSPDQHQPPLFSTTDATG